MTKHYLHVFTYHISEPGGRTSKVQRGLKAPMADSQVKKFRTAMLYLLGVALGRCQPTRLIGACKAHDVPKLVPGAACCASQNQFMTRHEKDGKHALNPPSIDLMGCEGKVWLRH